MISLDRGPERLRNEIRRLNRQMALLEQALSLALVAPCEHFLEQEPRMAVRTAGVIARAVMKALPALINKVDTIIEEDEGRLRLEAETDTA